MKNMEYSDFKEEVLRELGDFYGSDATVTVSEVVKNNDVRLDGINISFQDDQRIMPVLYLNGFYEQYADDVKSIPEIVEEIVDLRERGNDPGFDIDEITSLTKWDKIKDEVYPVLLSTESNRELLKKYVHKEFLDLSVIYIIRLSSNENGMGSVKITQDMMKGYDGITEDDLHAQALENMEKEGYRVQNILDVLVSMRPDFVDMDSNEPLNPAEMKGRMFVLSNRCKMYGAAGILNNRLLRSIGRSCFILPSSVHETIIVPDDEDMSEEALDNMVDEVNSTQLEPQDVLSDHAYYYDYDKDVLRMRQAA